MAENNDETIDDKFLNAVSEYIDSRKIDNTYDAKILKDIQEFINAGANVNSAIVDAAVYGTPELVKLLLAAGANVNLKEGKEPAALTKILEFHENPNMEMVKLLINAGADPNIDDGEPLTWAIEYNNIELFNILLSAGVDVNIGIFDGFSGDLPPKSSQLIFASLLNRTEIVKLLLAVPGIDINLQNEYGDSALIIACKEGNSEIIKLLLTAPGINVNLQNKDGDSALIITCRKGNAEIVKLLLADPKIYINLQNINGDTALAESTVKNNLNIVNILLINGADINIIDNGGNKAIEYAETHAMQDLLSAPSASLMMGKVNRGIVDIPNDNKTNSIAFDDITDGETVAHIKQFGKDFFYRLESWKDYMYNQLKNYPREPIKNPANREIVTADQIDIFTAHIVPAVQNAPVAGVKRPRPDNLRGGTRRRRKTRKANKQKRSTRRRHRI